MKKNNVKAIYIASGIFFFIGIVGYICTKYSQDSPEQIAQKKCSEIAQVTNVIPVDSPITVFVNGEGYRCQ